MCSLQTWPASIAVLNMQQYNRGYIWPSLRASEREPLEGRKDGVGSADGDIHDRDRSALRSPSLQRFSQYNITQAQNEAGGCCSDHVHTLYLPLNWLKQTLISPDILEVL